MIASALTLGPLGLHVRGDTALVVVLAVSVALLGMGLGLLASAFARSEFQVVQFLPLTIFPQFLLCGLLVPRQRMPSALHAISDAAAAVLRGRRHAPRTRDAGAPAALWGDIAIVLAFALGALLLGATTLRRRTA